MKERASESGSDVEYVMICLGAALNSSKEEGESRVCFLFQLRSKQNSYIL